ncbi:MAG: M48 family metallopeptidase [Candidatus Magasanikbacteria bacterium]|nr:M48 family metallopeptidase [Candidatus Magasanikbacteria bacterium]
MANLELGGKKINYEIKKSKRAKYVRVAILSDRDILVTIPHRQRFVNVERIFEDKQDWILKSLANYENNYILLKGGSDHYKKHKKTALELVENKIAIFVGSYNIEIGRVCVRNQKSRWGSCSSKGSLNFNYRLLFLPEHLAEYIIVHELCHLVELNHSHRFWALVEQEIPDYKACRKELRSKYKIVVK